MFWWVLSTFGVTLFLLGTPVSSWGIGSPETLDQLLEQVRQDSVQEQRLNADREANFLAARDKQKELLRKANADLQAEEQRSKVLKGTFEKNEKVLAEKQTELKDLSGSLGELFSVARQTAHDLLPTVSNSLVLAEFPDRVAVLSTIAESNKLPNIEDLQRLWLSLQEQMTESGKIETFSASVITVGGEVKKQQVSRVGTFTAISEGKYLRYLSEPVAGLVELNRQPASRFLKAAAEFEKAGSGAIVSMAIDPSRGAILSLLVQSPSLRERIDQGGWIGYFTIALGVVALLIALQRFIYLFTIGRRIDAQRHEEIPNEDNPLGRVLSVYTGNKEEDIEALNLKLDEAILKEMPQLERGLPTLAILADVAPLLGLLGTVTGMIKTFQAITMFGTSDPKLMSAGISEALVTTVIGLMVAIPILLIHSALSGKSNRLIQILDEESAAIVAWLAEKKQGLLEKREADVF
ncbi:MotA/TolQ/ExbB proton channel [Candidatus Nitrosoglobus terrae]|uniref:MotA/TolQ/ExbB proton channel n=1 Tax=Candidatus Nitrosoglobus terrae TaxID=1630141 RepID=A0A1Q2SKN5_9GAMM|nr:MotA/TolQ/ExbB proton channel family protein [Candidatus Nitrosoglobus terrae]BAW79679.1 MotA/TolQ/ExbB proton channel [Candidatus Nitrosoglobus terrae]